MQNQRDGILDYHFIKVHGDIETAQEDANANKYYQADADAVEGNRQGYQNIAVDPQVRQCKVIWQFGCFGKDCILLKTFVLNDD